MNHQDALNELRSYGLCDAVTADDDPIFWASVLLKHWPISQVINHRSPPHLTSLRFSVGRRLSESERLSAKSFTGIEEIENWLLEASDLQNLFATKGEPGAWPNFPWLSLMICRPTQNEVDAVVATSRMLGNRFGDGVSRIWKRQSDESWSESKETLAIWKS